jgi:hypothetical protein
MSATSILQRLVGSPLPRRIADSAVGRYAQRRVTLLNHESAAQAQHRTLLSLLRQGRRTKFGRDHDFARIRTLTDYQARVPLREYEVFWKEYWQPAFPFVDNVTWPGPTPYFALSSGTTTGTTKYIPVSPRMLVSNRRAAMTMLAFHLAAHPATPLFTGRMFFLGGSTDLQDLGTLHAANGVAHSRFRVPHFLRRPPASAILAGDLSGIATRELSPLLRPYTFPPLEIALIKDWERKMLVLAEESAKLPITLIGGVPSWLLVFFERLKQVSGRNHIADIWPTLRVVVHGGAKFDPYRTLFHDVIGSDAVHCLEIYPASEGFIAAEDPRHCLLRLIPDHGLFFEFVPVEELGKDRPTRHTVANLELGVQYAVVVTTCAGLWSYLIGDTVCFEKRDPPLLRFTGRTKYFLSAFGEHLISEEVEKAVAAAAELTGTAVVDFHVGPVFPDTPSKPGRHRFLIEFTQSPADLPRFTAKLDAELSRLNEDYAAHRTGDLTMLPPEIRIVPHGGFADWLRSLGKLGGQHKVPRMDNTGTITAELTRWMNYSHKPAISAR